MKLTDLARVTREEILLWPLAPESCIESTRALIEVARYFGVTARPAPMRVALFNAEATACIRAKVPTGEWPPSAFGMRIKNAGEVPAPGRWSGHLVAIAGGNLVDASLDQFSRPDRGITLEVGSGVFGLPADWDMKEELVLDRPDGLVIYRPIGDHTYRSFPSWREHRAEHRAVVASAIRRLRTLED